MNIQDIKFPDWPNVLKSQQLRKTWIDDVLFPLTDIVERLDKKELSGLLPGAEMLSLFVAESTRTRASFEIAIHRLGGKVIFNSAAAGKFSNLSLGKGESTEDTAITLSEYGADVIVLRHNEEGGVEKAASVSRIPIINAGDGPGQHPTQALLDIRTIQKYLHRIDGLTVALMGDIEGSRTIHSLAFLLAEYPGVTIYFVAPDHLTVKPGIEEHLRKHNVAFHREKDIRNVAGKVDVFYQTRTQTNLGSAVWDRQNSQHGFTIINREVLDLAKPESIIMHPLPCTDEIVRSEVDSDPRAIYIKTKDGRMSQVRVGLFVRMALLLTVISPETSLRLLESR